MLNIQTFLLTILGVLIAIDVHECAHAWTADKLGDPTARLMGRVSLNPIRHLDPLGSVMIVLSSMSGFGIGWGKPVPVNGYRLKYGRLKGTALVSLAGPVSNLLAAVVLAVPLRLPISMPYTVAWILSTLAFVNVIIAVFNLIPIPPLDGFGVLMGIIGSIKSKTAYDAVNVLSRLEARGPMVLLAVLMLDFVLPVSVLGTIMNQPVRLLWSLIGG